MYVNTQFYRHIKARLAFVRQVSYNGRGPLGLKDVRVAVIKKLEEGRIQHETTRSGDINEKNLLLTGRVTVDEVVEIIMATKGTGFTTSKLHGYDNIDVHIFEHKKKGINWYIKCYLIEPDIWFISVHH